MSKKKSDKEIAEAQLAQLKKALGITDDSVRYGDQHMAITDVISTGVEELDKILTPMVYEQRQIGGVPRGFCCEFFGPHAGGKSSLCMKLASGITRKGSLVFWVDAESSFIPEWATRHKIDNSKLVLVDGGNPQGGEYYLELVEKAADSGKFELIVVDSVTALTPKQVLDTSLADEARVGASAKMMTRAMPRIVSAAKRGNTAVVFINQIRQKVGVMYGNPETTPGGEALKFYASLRLRLSQVSGKSERGIIKDEEEIGIRTNCQIVKSRFGPPYREAVIPIYYGNTVPHPLDLIIDAALAAKVVKSRSKKTGLNDYVQTFTYNDIKVDGIDEFKKKLTNDLIKGMAEALKGKHAFDSDVVSYLKSLDSDDPTVIVETSEGDPGE